MQEKQARLAQMIAEDIQRTNGCTDPGSVSFAVAKAVSVLGERPARIRVAVSPNLFKNAYGVGVPGSGQRGLPIAAALGAVIAHSEAGLAILGYVTPEKVQEAQALLNSGAVEISIAPSDEPLFIRAEVSSRDHTAAVVIANDYANIVEISLDQAVRFKAAAAPSEQNLQPIRSFRYAEIYSLIETADPGHFTFLLEAARTNEQAVRRGSANPELSFGQVYAEGVEHLPQPLAMMAQTRRWTAMASEARMNGQELPIMALGGSGNQGITAFLGILAAARSLNKPESDLAKALAIGAATALYIKSFMARLTAVCGSALAVAPGVAAATVFLLGGAYQDAVHAIQSVIASLNGVLCEGAGPLCPFKLSGATALAVECAHLALQGVYAPAGFGAIHPDIERTFENLGQINASLAATDRLVLKLMQSSQE